MNQIESKGDYIFKENLFLINQVMKFDPNKLIPLLIAALNIKDSGNHEACTVFALLLKIGKKFPDKVKNYILNAKKDKSAPDYYLQKLETKIS